MPVDDTDADSERRRALERIVFSNRDPAAIDQATRELEALRQALRRAQGPSPAVAEATPVAEPTPVAELVEAPTEVAEPTEVADPTEVAELVEARDRRRPLLLTAAAVGILVGGILLGTVLAGAGLGDPITPDSDLDGSTAPLGDISALGDVSSPAPETGTAFIDINTGQVVGYGGVEAAAALEIFDREQTDADRPTFPLAADLQPSTTRLLEMAGSASIFAAMDTLARPCLVVVGPNQYSATCQTDFEFPKAGIRLSWAPSVPQEGAPSEIGRTSPVVYTVVWLPNGMVEVGALVQGR